MHSRVTQKSISVELVASEGSPVLSPPSAEKEELPGKAAQYVTLLLNSAGMVDMTSAA